MCIICMKERNDFLLKIICLYGRYADKRSKREIEAVLAGYYNLNFFKKQIEFFRLLLIFVFVFFFVYIKCAQTTYIIHNWSLQPISQYYY